MFVSAKIAPPNSLLLVAGTGGGEIPESFGGAMIASTSTCIAIGCRSEADGETEVILGRAEEIDPGDNPCFEDFLETPTRRILIRTVLGDTLLEAPVPDVRTGLRIWLNDNAEPDRIMIGIL